MTVKLVRRPVLSIVISIIIAGLGLLSLLRLPMTQFPNIAPAEVNVTVEYTGANAETVTKSAIVPLERSINGVPNMKYMSSDAGNDGVGVIQIIFEAGTDPDVASVNVQNRVAAVMGELPPEIVRNGVKIAKEENAMLMYVNIFSSDPLHDEKFLYNFADIHVLSELKRIQGVGFADILGAREYAIRVWLDPNKMLAHSVSAEEVIKALEEYSVEAAPGKLGESSDRADRHLQYVLRHSGKLNAIEPYQRIPVRALASGEILRLNDIAEIEFSSTYYDVEARFNGRPAAAIMLKQLPGSNASLVVSGVKDALAALQRDVFLPGMRYEVTYDVANFLDASIKEVWKTLLEAFSLVALVTLFFLQNWRLTLVPLVAVPVSLIGTFAAMSMLGFSLNLITLFALVLAIGIVVDDAIVVVEAIHAKYHSTTKSKIRSTEIAMSEITGAIIAITLVMASVFLPVILMPGPEGIFFRQFSLTMAVAITLSGFIALTLSPSLSARLLGNRAHESQHKLLHGYWWTPFGAFNRVYSFGASFYTKILHLSTRWYAVSWVLVLLSGVILVLLRSALPVGFIPNEDQGMFLISVTSPPGATLERTKASINEIRKRVAEISSVASVSTLAGTNILSDGTGATYGTCMVSLAPWQERRQSLSEVMDDARRRVWDVRDVEIEVFPPPAVPGYGNASGFELRLLDKTGSGDLKQMERVVDQFLVDLRSTPEIGSAFSIFNASFPQRTIRIDSDIAAQMGVSTGDALSALQTMVGGRYVTNFIRFGQMYKVMVQALPEYRASPEDALRCYVSNKHGELVQLSTFASLENSQGVDQITRYNMYPSAEINGAPSLGHSSGDAIDAVLRIASSRLPRGYGIDWAGISRDEVTAGNESVFIFIICITFVYLLLAAQYESFLLPVAVILSVVPALAGAHAALWLLDVESNIYAKLAMLMLVGLVAKNAILIVEFAAVRHRNGMPAAQAAIAGAEARLRPILMTSVAAIAGLCPLMFASGVGAVGNRTIGTAAVGGMVVGTLLGLVITPGVYLSLARISEKRVRHHEELPLTEED